MYYRNSFVLFATFMWILIMLSGCFLFGLKGILESSNYQIVKLEIDNRVILSPQELANEAREQGGLQQHNDIDISLYEANRQRPTSRIDDINSAFEQLKQRNQQDDVDDNVGTPLSELAKINLKSTFNLDRSQDMLYGKVGCNDYTAKFFWQDTTKIVISGTASTRKVCSPKEVTEFQNIFVRNFDGIYVITKLKNRKGYVLNNGRMRIYIK